MYDPTRLVDATTGWNDMGVGDFIDIHSYPGPASPKPEARRAAVLGEFGGLGLPIEGHLWKVTDKNWGYRGYQSREELTDAFVNLMEQTRAQIHEPGLSAAVYTQTTDVETECNGLMTYDRAIMKVDLERAAAAIRRLYLPPPVIKPIVPTSKESGQTWRYTTEQPAETWAEASFDDSKWKEGTGGFGTQGTPGVVVRTEWKTADIWLRRTVDLREAATNPMLSLYHDEGCEIYLNGQMVAKAVDYTTDYVLVPVGGKGALKAGKNVLAVHCHQTKGGQGIDVGILDVIEPTP